MLLPVACVCMLGQTRAEQLPVIPEWKARAYSAKAEIWERRWILYVRKLKVGR